VLTVDEVAALALAMPGVVEGVGRGHRSWTVGKKTFAWERNFSKADIKRFGDEPVPEGPILAIVVDDLAEKAAMLELGLRGVFTISHFDGYAAVLVQLKRASKRTVRDLLEDGWLACAPAALVSEYLRRT
jgi:hypothetical protein